MQLLTEAIKKALPPLYSTEDIPTENKEFICKFFNPLGVGSWLVAEGEEQEDGDWLFFGLANIFHPEWGYFSLRELEEVGVGLGLGIERDICYGSEDLHPEWESKNA